MSNFCLKQRQVVTSTKAGEAGLRFSPRVFDRFISKENSLYIYLQNTYFQQMHILNVIADSFFSVVLTDGVKKRIYY